MEVEIILNTTFHAESGISMDPEIDQKKYMLLLTAKEIEVNLNYINKEQLKGMFGYYRGDLVYIQTVKYNISKHYYAPLMCVRVKFLEGTNLRKEKIVNIEHIEQITDLASLDRNTRWKVWWSRKFPMDDEGATLIIIGLLVCVVIVIYITNNV